MKRGNFNLVAIFLLMIACFCGAMLAANSVLADNNTVIDQVNVTVEESCTLAGVGMDSHVATLHNAEYSGQSGSDYVNGIGKTTLTAFCNDYNGFSIYAIGFTGDSYTDTNHTKLVGATDNNNTISTGLYTSGDTTSSWAMKVDKITDGTISYIPANMSIQNSFDSWHLVPDTYTKVAQYHANSGSSVTDTVLGGKIESTYAVYVSDSQIADTYTGKVKYTLVHPYDGTPLQPQIANPGCINYFPNGNDVEGTMGCQSATDGNSVTLFASNFSRDGYGFAGWSDAFDYATNANAHFYGPNEDITVPAGTTNNGLALYAVWIRSVGDMQTDAASVCSGLTAATYSNEGDADESTWSITANLSSISALTDVRDNQTYAIAKLTDGNCWMIENLRLADTHQKNNTTVPTTLTIANTNNPLNNGTIVTLKHNYSGSQTYTNLSATSSDATSWCSSNSAECDDQSRLRTDNTENRVSYTSIQTMSKNASLYSYGNYYNWYSATAGRGTYGFDTKFKSVEGDLCPAGWHLPYGNDNTGPNGGNTSGGFYYLTNSMSATVSNAINSNKHRHFPNNFLFSGYVDGASLSYRGFDGYYWSSTTYNSDGAFYLNFYLSSVSSATMTNYKYKGQPIRCTMSS